MIEQEFLERVRNREKIADIILEKIVCGEMFSLVSKKVIATVSWGTHEEVIARVGDSLINIDYNKITENPTRYTFCEPFEVKKIHVPVDVYIPIEEV